MLVKSENIKNDLKTGGHYLRRSKSKNDLATDRHNLKRSKTISSPVQQDQALLPQKLKFLEMPQLGGAAVH